jgi:hypothetical protein
MSALTRQFRFGFATLALAASLQAADEVLPVVANPTKRHESLESAKALLTGQTVSLPANLVNPFNPPAFAEVTGARVPNPGAVENPAAHPAGPRSDRDILQAIASGLKPTGFFVLSGQPTLVFGQKRVKAGGYVTITFEGTEYTLEITVIERPNFTLRLNREEFTRPIK